MIDLITNLDMHAFQSHGGLNALTKRLEVSFVDIVTVYYWLKVGQKVSPF